MLIVFDAGYDVTRLAWQLADLPVELVGKTTKRELTLKARREGKG